MRLFFKACLTLLAVTYVPMCIDLYYKTNWFHGWKDPLRLLYRIRERGNSMFSESSTLTVTCLPERNILFLKTHKTGSSTMANIFFRYGDSRNLTFILPKEFSLLEWPRRFQVAFAIPLNTTAPNILCSHTRFNKKPMNWLFPKGGSKYLTILRNPVENFESVFRYMKVGDRLGIGHKPDSLQRFLQKGIPFFVMRRKAYPLTRNPLLHDLGLSFKYYQNLTAVNEYIQFLDKEFDLVMIMDYFDESLVLMKRLLCWQMEDILYLKLNERQDKEKDTVLTDNVRENVRRWNKADVLLFEYFNKSFWKKIENEGESFHKELSIFRQKNWEIKRTCVTNGTRLQTIYKGKQAKGYVIKNNLPGEQLAVCQKLITSEIDYLEHLRVKQRQPSSQFEMNQPTMETEHKREDNESWELAQDLAYEPVELV